MGIFVSKKLINFITLAQTNNIAKAAEKLHMTASPFGKSIAALEEMVGYELFSRTDNSISLNKAGQELYQMLYPIYQRLAGIDTEIMLAGYHRQRSCVIGIDTAYPTIIFDQLISLGDKFDGFTTKPFDFNESDLVSSLLDHDMDMIISPQQASPRVSEISSMQVIPLEPLKLGFLVSRIHDNVPPNELLHSLPWLQMRFQHRANFESLIDAHFRHAGITPTIIYRPYSFLAKISAVNRGQFITVVPHFAYRFVNPASLKYFDAPNKPMYMPEYLYSLKSCKMTGKLVTAVRDDRSGNVSPPA
ncbi:LysR family transcriptional regulator SrsR [Martelella alba]|uniref:LysR family transcriptional regulator n=1 Tax=Martelella alba TaxID=2590451 RepID=A0ABY2SP86_9HYPH|nr:LysR family transcriptional regulator [Martelella alba]TKI07778.1 LysR family transcriptional regulator [Martelella alba]